MSLHWLGWLGCWALARDRTCFHITPFCNWKNPLAFIVCVPRLRGGNHSNVFQGIHCGCVRWVFDIEQSHKHRVNILLNGRGCNMGVSKNNGTPKSSIFNRVFRYKPSILGYPYFWKHPYVPRQKLETHQVGMMKKSPSRPFFVGWF